MQVKWVNICQHLERSLALCSVYHYYYCPPGPCVCLSVCACWHTQMDVHWTFQVCVKDIKNTVLWNIKIYISWKTVRNTNSESLWVFNVHQISNSYIKFENQSMPVSFLLLLTVFWEYTRCSCQVIFMYSEIWESYSVLSGLLCCCLLRLYQIFITVIFLFFFL